MTAPDFPEDLGDGKGFGRGHADLLNRLTQLVDHFETEVERLDARIDGVGGGGDGLGDVLVKPISGDVILTESEVQDNFIIWIDSANTPTPANLESTAQPFDLSGGRTNLKLDNNVGGAFEADLSGAPSWPPVSVAAVTAVELQAFIDSQFGSGSPVGYNVQTDITATKVIVNDNSPTPIGFTQIRAVDAVTPSDANDSIQFPETWQIGTPELAVTYPAVSGGRSLGNFFLLGIKDQSKTITLKQPGGAIIVVAMGNPATHCYWTGSLWIIQ